MLDLYLDIDAHCVYPQILRAAQRHSLDLYVVTKDYLHAGEKLHLILAQEGQTDGGRWILTNIARGDICITADFELAANCALLGAVALSLSGRQWNADIVTGDARGAAEAQPLDTHAFAQRLEKTISATRAAAFLQIATQRGPSRPRPVAAAQRFSMPRTAVG